jgi:diadenosine tetraphosphatase ApaH/serine/threonine PP2A family protein phosphatase
MKCGRRAAGVELAVAMDSLARRQSLDLDTPLPELLNRLRVGTHLPVRARAYNEPLRQLIDDLAEVGEDESVPIGPPPIGKHAVRQDDHVTRLFLTVDEETTEVVALDPRHRLTSDYRFVLSIPCPG